jgi:hypothetical protein
MAAVNMPARSLELFLLASTGMAASAAFAGGSSGPAAALLPRPPFRMWSFDYNATASGPD